MLISKLVDELGFWPATTNPEDIERHRRLNAALEKAPDLEKIAQKYAHLHVAARSVIDRAGISRRRLKEDNET